jgi:adenylate kinase family enzyme
VAEWLALANPARSVVHGDWRCSVRQALVREHRRNYFRAASEPAICPPAICFARRSARSPGNTAHLLPRRWTALAGENWFRTKQCSDSYVSACSACTAAAAFWLAAFPARCPQAEQLERLLQAEKLGLDAVINYELDRDKIVERLSGRLVCPGREAGYHRTAMPPNAECVCDHCGQPLLQWEDDRPDSIRVRMKAY